MKDARGDVVLGEAIQAGWRQAQSDLRVVMEALMVSVKAGTSGDARSALTQAYAHGFFLQRTVRKGGGHGGAFPAEVADALDKALEHIACDVHAKALAGLNKEPT